MPKLWNETIEAHRQDVRSAILDTAGALVVEHGLRSVTMQEIAEKAGIGRATLYKYFPDVEAILFAWHERLVGAHLEQLGKLGGGEGPPGKRLEAVLEAYALIQHEHRGATELVHQLHRGEHAHHAHQHRDAMFRELLGECVKAGEVRKDVPLDELTQYCVHALAAAGELRSRNAVRRLVEVTLAGLRPPR